MVLRYRQTFFGLNVFCMTGLRIPRSSEFHVFVMLHVSLCTYRPWNDCPSATINSSTFDFLYNMCLFDLLLVYSP